MNPLSIQLTNLPALHALITVTSPFASQPFIEQRNATLVLKDLPELEEIKLGGNALSTRHLEITSLPRLTLFYLGYSSNERVSSLILHGMHCRTCSSDLPQLISIHLEGTSLQKLDHLALICTVCCWLST